MKHCESRTIRLIAFWLKNKITSKGKNVYRYEEELIDETDNTVYEPYYFEIEMIKSQTFDPFLKERIIKDNE